MHQEQTVSPHPKISWRFKMGFYGSHAPGYNGTTGILGMMAGVIQMMSRRAGQSLLPAAPHF
jgi:hypothetical protein